MSSSTKLNVDSSRVEVSPTLYKSIIGSLLYLTASRPNIAFSVGVCARYQAAPKESHLTVVKWITRYINGTPNYGLRLARGCKPPKWCTHAKHARSWSVAPAVALQDKSPRLARPFVRGLNSRLNPGARSSRQNTLFGKIWLFTFRLTLLYIYTLIPMI